MRAKLNAAVVGCGWAGQIHAEACQRHPDTSLVAVCDPDFDKAKRVASRLNCTAYPSLTQLLDTERVNVACVASPTETHPALCQQLLDAGSPVLCEKPISRDSESARRIVDDFDARGLAFGVNYNRRFASGYKIAMQRIEASGPVRFLSCILAQNVPLAQTEELRSRLPKDYLIFDALSHQLDLAYFLAGKPVQVAAIGSRKVSGQLWTDIMVGLRFENGAIGSLICSLFGPEWGQLPIERTEIGTEGERILVEDITARVEWFGYREKVSHSWSPGIFEPTGYVESMYASISAWLDAVYYDKPVPIPARDGVLAVKLCEQVRDQLETQRQSEL
jgi:predicted dehydrogenase